MEIDNMKRAWKWRTGVPGGLTRAWILSYLERHPTLTLREIVKRICNIYMN